jgi:hypothetical protein
MTSDLQEDSPKSAPFKRLITNARRQFQSPLDPAGILLSLRDSRRTLALSLVVGALIGLWISFFQPPRYQAVTRIHIQAEPLTELSVPVDELEEDWLTFNQEILLDRATLRSVFQQTEISSSDLSRTDLRELFGLNEFRDSWELTVLCETGIDCADVVQVWAESALAQLKLRGSSPDRYPAGAVEANWSLQDFPETRLIYWGRTSQILAGALIALLLASGSIVAAQTSGAARDRAKQPVHFSEVTTGNRILQIGQKAAWPLWLVMVFLVPWTSSPLVTAILGYNAVSPLALVPLGGLLVFALIPHLWRRGRLSSSAWPLFFFTLAAGITAASAFFLPVEPLKGITQLSRGLRSSITLFIGLAFFTVSSLMPSSDRRTRTFLRALYGGAVVALLWGSIQAYFVLTDSSEIPFRFEQIHRMMVIRAPIVDRVTAMAFEPAWFADLLVVLYLPLWLGSLLTRYSVFTSRKTLFSFELALSLWGTILLLLTFSRIGYLAFWAMLGVLIMAAAWRGSGAMMKHIQRRSSIGAGWMGPALRGLSLILAAAFVLGLSILVLWYLSQQDPNMADPLDLPATIRRLSSVGLSEGLYTLSGFFGLAERYVFWEAGVRTFIRHPILGVGLGNYGFFFPKSVSHHAMELQEIRQVLNPSYPFLANPKNLWVRLLAETGIVGTSLFLVWLFSMIRIAKRVSAGRSELRRLIGVAGILSITALVVEGLSLDTFALPQMWIVLGLLASQTEANSTAGLDHGP